MRAGEFLKLFELDAAKAVVASAPVGTLVVMKDWPNNMYFSLDECDRWLRYSHASQTWVRFYARCNPTSLGVYLDELEEAIADVESCQ